MTQYLGSSLVLVLDDIINIIPIEVLLTEEVGQYSAGDMYNQLPYLIRKVPIRYASAPSLIYQEVHRSDYNKGLLA